MLSSWVRSGRRLNTVRVLRWWTRRVTSAGTTDFPTAIRKTGLRKMPLGWKRSLPDLLRRTTDSQRRTERNGGGSAGARPRDDQEREDRGAPASDDRGIRRLDRVSDQLSDL